MTYNFLACDRGQAFLLPPDLRDWLPQDHLAWFILDVVEQLDLAPFYRAHRDDGHGHPADHPKTLLGVLLDAYCLGVRSSRQIERHLHEDVAFRVLAATQTPDQVTIARFRARHEQAWPSSSWHRSSCARPPGWSASVWSPWMGPRWLPTPPSGPTAPTSSSRKRSPRSCARPPRLTSARIEHGDARGDELPAARRQPPAAAHPRSGLGRSPDWRPDGRQLAFASDRAGNFDLYMMGRDGSQVRQAAGLVAMKCRGPYSV